GRSPVGHAGSLPAARAGHRIGPYPDTPHTRSGCPLPVLAARSRGAATVRPTPVSPPSAPPPFRPAFGDPPPPENARPPTGAPIRRPAHSAPPGFAARSSL